MSKSKRIEGPFTSEFGTFHPGCEAIAITVCTGAVNVARVEYIGYVERKTYNWHTKTYESEKFAQVRRPTKTFTPFWAGTEEKAHWPYGDRNVEYRDVHSTTISTLQHNRLLPAGSSTDELMKAV